MEGARCIRLMATTSRTIVAPLRRVAKDTVRFLTRMSYRSKQCKVYRYRGRLVLDIVYIQRQEERGSGEKKKRTASIYVQGKETCSTLLISDGSASARTKCASAGFHYPLVVLGECNTAGPDRSVRQAPAIQLGHSISIGVNCNGSPPPPLPVHA